MKELTDRQSRLIKARLYLDKHFQLGWNCKWKDSDHEVKKLARLLNSKTK